MLEMQGHVLPDYCLREREGEGLETSPLGFPWACRHLESLRLPSTTQGPFLLKYEPLQACVCPSFKVS